MSTKDLPEALADVLAGVQRLIRRRLRQGLTEPRLRGAQVELLRLVSANPGIGVSAAAKELYLAGNSVSTLVNQLTAAGLLRRETDPADRRSALLLPTAEAEARLRAWQERRAVLVRRHVERLGEDDRAALAAALPVLRRLAEGLREEAEDTLGEAGTARAERERSHE
ncbi:MarR family transcriptional regulator [Streptosporangium sp. NPDC051022]|uniref:MarR family winged helix-turn-helix transcriptional regulator n=1 Tax=Streptosporangium sp. NPDC051022 TaxID=3155752 RepID=UPI0034398D03